MRLIDTTEAHRVRSAGFVLLAAVLVMRWALPATSNAARLTISALLCSILITVMVPLVRLLFRARRVPGFFWREYRRGTFTSIRTVLVVSVGLAMLWVLPANSIGTLVVEGAVLVLLGLASTEWTILIISWLRDRRRPTSHLRFGESYWLNHPVVEMRDQDGARRAFPDDHSALDLDQAHYRSMIAKWAEKPGV
jgi:hypothetical protein